MIRRPPRSTLSSSSAASDVYKRQRGKSRLETLVLSSNYFSCRVPSLDSASRLGVGAFLEPQAEARLKALKQITKPGYAMEDILDTYIEPNATCLLYTSPSPRDS
eukprot:TRINITY_DN41815_c0_g1_i1.p1 TRINITY_DN41815_c0_g1~~TRINITY_DN41815_c0_g1_i1.p1  ORF type:complete len:105 (-),score=28.41 TRINITY_DN41815_c0_g1_i1:175-489(-)